MGADSLVFPEELWISRRFVWIRGINGGKAPHTGEPHWGEIGGAFGMVLAESPDPPFFIPSPPPIIHRAGKSPRWRFSLEFAGYPRYPPLYYDHV
jgi:hypothetical protein